MNPTSRFYECCGATVEKNNAGFRLIFSDIEILLTQLYQVALNAVLNDQAYYIIKTANAAKCAITSFIINAWYVIAGIYVILQMFQAEHYIGGVIDLYYPVLCSCKIEMA